MSQSLSKIYLHIVFSTKYRTPWITKSIQPELYAYMTAVLNAFQSPAIKIGGIADHVHILCRQSKTIAPCKLVELVKKRSSRWIKTKGSEFRDFRWQVGYGMFSVCRFHVTTVQRYIANQEAHHRKVDYKQEYRRLLREHGVDFDERYLWD